MDTETEAKMAQRLKELRRALGMNQRALAAQLGITQTAYSMIETGRRSLSPAYVKVLVTAFGISEGWLLHGEGEMFAKAPDLTELSLILGHLTPEGRQYLLIMARELLRMQSRQEEQRRAKHQCQ